MCFSHAKCDFDTHECHIHTHNCDLGTQTCDFKNLDSTRILSLSFPKIPPFFVHFFVTPLSYKTFSGPFSECQLALPDNFLAKCFHEKIVTDQLQQIISWIYTHTFTKKNTHKQKKENLPSIHHAMMTCCLTDWANVVRMAVVLSV
jgi:hypothetical protein